MFVDVFEEEYPSIQRPVRSTTARPRTSRHRYTSPDPITNVTVTQTQTTYVTNTDLDPDDIELSDSELTEILNESLQTHTPYTPGLPQKDIDTIKNAPLRETPEDTKCIICTNRYYNDDSRMLQFTCTHYYHKDCILSWVRENKNCPMCRADMKLIVELEDLYDDQEEYYSERDEDVDIIDDVTDYRDISMY